MLTKSAMLDGLSKYTNKIKDSLGGDVFTGATSSKAGVIGYVPAPKAGDNTKFLRGDGTWVIPTDTNTTYSAATTTSSGLMSYSDKRKLNNLASITTAGANITISNGTISGTPNTTYTAGSNITISGTTISGTANTTYTAATTTSSGLMSYSDKQKLNNLASITTAGANITISGGTISSANTTYTAGTNVTISSGVISAAGTTFVTDSAFTSMLNSVFS